MKSLRTMSMRELSACFLVCFALFSIGWYGSRFQTLHEVSANAAKPVRHNDPEYQFISPLVSVSIANADGFPELKRVKADVTEIIRSAQSRGDIESAGVYFRLPDNAHWFGINENDEYIPGSLIKVPIMLAILKQSENNSSLLTRQLNYDANLISDIPDALKAQLPSGRYSIEKLLRTMIVDSDNVAKELLYNAAGTAAIQDVFDEMNANFLTDPSGTISPKSYTVFLSRIYNATYLNRHYSNYAMNLLTETTFKDGLVAGLPADTKVAHKYGESGIYEDGVLTSVELHDCGLIYAPSGPYYLCIMTKGKRTANLARLIQDISAAVYKQRTGFKPDA